MSDFYSARDNPFPPYDDEPIGTDADGVPYYEGDEIVDLDGSTNYTEADIKDRIAEKKINGEYVYEKRVMREHLSKEKADDWLYQNMTAHSEYIYMHCHQEKDN